MMTAEDPSPPDISQSIKASKAKILVVAVEGSVISTATKTSTKRKTGTKAIKYEVEEEEEEEEEEHDTIITKTKTTRPRKRKQDDDDIDSRHINSSVTIKKHKTTTTTTTRKKKATSMAIPLASRALASKMLVGAHVSMAKGVQNAITNSVHIGGNAFALFLKNQRRWTAAPLPASDAAIFRAACKTHSYNPLTQILPHGSYLINLAQPSAEKAAQAYDSFLDDLCRCEALGIGLYNFHPGATLGEPRPAALARIAAALNRAHAETKFVKTLIENMVGSGTVVGSAFEDLRDIIAGVTDKTRVGVCLDTCHLFAAGHDIRNAASYAKVMQQFDDIVGREYLCALHLNDSKGPFASKKDLHQNIGQGYIGLEGFRVLMNDSRLEGVPMVLETPSGEDPGVWAREIKLLESLVGMTGEEEEFLLLSRELHDKGKVERERIKEIVERVGKTKGAKKKKKKAETASESEGEGDDGCNH